MFTALGSAADFSFLFRSYNTARASTSTSTRSSSINSYAASHFSKHLSCTRSIPARRAERLKVSCSARAEGVEREVAVGDDSQESDVVRRSRGSADWETARACKESGVIYDGRIEGFNGGGLLSIGDFKLAVAHSYLTTRVIFKPLKCAGDDPNRSIQEIAKDLVGSSISVKVVQVGEEDRNLILSEKDAIWSKFSGQVNVGDIFEARVGSVEDYGAFVHLRFPDGCYYLTGLVHVSEVSWDLVQDVRDILNEGDEVKVKVIRINREKARITLSLKQLEDDPLLETLDKVIPRVNSGTSNMSDGSNTEPFPGLESICKELLQEDGITDVKIGRKGFEKRVVSQDLELWLSNAPVEDKQFTLLARAGREGGSLATLMLEKQNIQDGVHPFVAKAKEVQVQEVYLTTDLNQEDIKKAVQRVLLRIP